MTLEEYQRKAIYRTFAFGGTAVLVMLISSQIGSSYGMLAGWLMMTVGLLSLGGLLPRRKPPHLIAKELREQAEAERRGAAVPEMTTPDDED